jgi:hypothetical protein
MEDFSWTTGGNSKVSHVTEIAHGAFGEVHKVQPMQPMLTIEMMDTETKEVLLTLLNSSPCGPLLRQVVCAEINPTSWSRLPSRHRE